MASKVYRIEEPRQLMELEKFAKETPSGLNSVIRVWQANRRKNGKTPWDNSFHVVFSGTRERKAYILRLDAKYTPVQKVPVRYNLAMHYCEEHLEETSRR